MQLLPFPSCAIHRQEIPRLPEINASLFMTYNNNFRVSSRTLFTTAETHNIATTIQQCNNTMKTQPVSRRCHHSSRSIVRRSQSLSAASHSEESLHPKVTGFLRALSNRTQMSVFEETKVSYSGEPPQRSMGKSFEASAGTDLTPARSRKSFSMKRRTFIVLPSYAAVS